MHRAHRYIASFFLTAALAAPIAIMAAPMPQVSVQLRYYDKNHKDYHNWDDRENHAWGLYLSNNRKKDHEFAKASSREQSQYWTWRHNHPDQN